MRLVTRGDMDGLTCMVLLTTMEKIDEIKFTHPKDMQDGKVEITADDIIANLPYHPKCAMWFDHHSSEEEGAKNIGQFKGKYGLAPSAARLIAEYYNSPKLKKFDELLEATDRMTAPS